MNDFADFANFAIEAASVTKRFGGNVAIKDISLKIAPGEFFSFLGPSGCGKTTLLRMIAGFETPSEGDILINGKSVIAVPPHKRPVNMVFQSYALFPHLTVLENIAFGLKAKAGINKAEVIERSRAALELVRLAHLSERLPAQLSGGQQQRIALARAVVNRPAVLLLDEPLSALDPQIREEMQFELGRLQRNLGMTFVMVTHDQAEALALSTRVAVFCLGNLEQVGKPEEIYNQPRTLFVAKFIGQTNLLKGTLIQRNDGLARIELSGFSGPGSSSQPNQASAGGSTDKSATAAATETGSDSAKHSAHILTVRDSINQNDGAACATGDRVCVWVKPQAVELRLHDSTAATTDASGVAGLANSFPAEVVARSYQGVSTEYLLEFGDGAPPNRASMRACLRTGTKDGESAPFEVGDKVMVTIPEQASSFLSDCDFAGATSSAGAAPAGETDKGERQQAPIGAASL